MKTYFKSKKTIFVFTVTQLILALTVIAPGMLLCQDTGFKFFKNYDRKDYMLHAQNWWIIQDQRGIIYSGNQNGLLEFDGVTWRSIEIPNNSVRSLTLDETDTLYIGGVGEIGFLKPGENKLQYVSLVDRLKENQKKNFYGVDNTCHQRGDLLQFL